MNNSPASLLLDVGGQSVLALALDDQWRIRFESRQSVSTQELDDRVELDPDELAEALQTLVRKACAALGTPGHNHRLRVALAVQRGSVVCWDAETTKALSSVLSWRDRRCPDELRSLADKAHIIRELTGLRYSPYAGAPKLAWLLQHAPAVQTAARQERLVCGPLGSFLTARLTRHRPALVDHTLAQRTLLWSARKLDWDRSLLDLFGLPAKALPQVVTSSRHYGQLQLPSCNADLDLLIGDQNCLPFMDGGPDPDSLYINLGTGAFLLRPTPQRIDDERFQTTLLDERRDQWALEASVHGCASALNWLQRTHQVHAADHDWSETREQVTDPPLFLNRIDGLGSPWWQTQLAPEFTTQADPASLTTPQRLLAVLESIAFLIRANAEAMQERLGSARRVVICGGLSQSATLCELIADTLQQDLKRLRPVEGTAWGLHCRLHDRALPADCFERIRHHDRPELRQRYAEWLMRIDNAPGS